MLRQVLDNLARSLRRAPRSVTIVYKNPVHEDAILATGLFERRASYRFGRFAPWVVYVSRDPGQR